MHKCTRPRRPGTDSARQASWCVRCGIAAPLALSATPALAQDCGPGTPRGWFAEDLLLPTLGEPWAIGTADLNMDGAPDLLVGDRLWHHFPDAVRPDLVQVWMGDGKGGFEFAQPLTIGIGALPFGFVSEDLDSDGDPDVAVVNQQGDSVTVLLGSPSGRLTVGQTVAVGDGPIAIVSGDVDGDGDTDLMVSSFADDQVSLLTNRGDASFEQRVVVDTIRNLGPIALADFDNDGDPDLAMRGRNEVWVSENSAGRFERRTVLPIDGIPRDVRADDLNGDGLVDLIVGVDGAALVYPAQGGLTFADATEYDARRPGDAHSEASSWRPIDMDGDGLIDLVSPEWGGSEVVVLPGLASGGFGRPIRSIVTTGVGALAIADFDLDGIADIAVADTEAPGVPVLLGSPDGTLGKRLIIAEPQRLAGSLSADFDGDGDQDIVAVQEYVRGSGEVELLLLRNAGGGRMFEQDVTPFMRELALLQSADLDMDGDPDLIAVDTQESELVLLWNDGSGMFSSRLGPVLSHQGSVFAVADVDNDGDLDLMSSFRDEVLVHRNLSSGVFEQIQAIEASESITGLAVGDFNGDGFLDAATCGQRFDDVAVLLGRGAAGFDPARTIASLAPSGESPFGIIAVDLTGDGVLDLVTANSRSDNLAVLVGQGDGSFGPPRFVALEDQPYSIRAQDINADGAIDLVLGISRRTLAVLINDGMGSLSPAREVVSGWLAGPFELADFDSDGVEDLLVDERISSDIRRMSITFGLGACDRCVADVDGDGELTVLDFLAFDQRLTAGDPRADLDGDGELTLFDFLAFQTAFDAGCP